jgi:hypothetical protein
MDNRADEEEGSPVKTFRRVMDEAHRPAPLQELASYETVARLAPDAALELGGVCLAAKDCNVPYEDSIVRQRGQTV